jgi:flagellar biosynthesis/type III secretory pathway M-ring protein FliF/YscJ
MPDRSRRRSVLDEIADEETALHLASRSHLHLEAAISSMLDIYTPSRVAEILREWAEQMDEYG